MTATLSSPPTSPVSSYSQRPRRQGVNWRLVIFLGVLSLPFLAIAFVFVRSQLNGGVVHHGDYAEVDLKALGNFPFNENGGTVNEVPARFRELDGKKVELEGFMYARRSAGDTATEFQFVYNVTKCCFNGPPLVQERVFARAPRAVPVYDMYTFARVTGTLHVRATKDPETGKVISLYTLDVDKSEAKS